ncbi:hypothetical protein [Haloarcula japonica]|uniref:hypothetical protein n=1 Tax=Haloarcula japonica TaxID=29282 RepID=UPI000ABA9BB6
MFIISSATGRHKITRRPDRALIPLAEIKRANDRVSGPETDGWTTVSFPDAVDSVSVGGGKVDGQLCLILIGEREDGPRIIETGVLDVEERNQHLMEDTVPD